MHRLLHHRVNLDPATQRLRMHLQLRNPHQPWVFDQARHRRQILRRHPRHQRIQAIGSRQRAQDRQHIAHPPTQRPADQVAIFRRCGRIVPGIGNQPCRRLVPHRAAECRRDANRPAHIRADAKHRPARRHQRPLPARRPARGPRHIPRVAGASVDQVIAL